jgi:hypothetical protein
MSSWNGPKVMALVATLVAALSIIVAGINSQSTKGIAFDLSQKIP